MLQRRDASTSRQVAQILHARLAAHAVRPPARPARPLRARYRDRGYRAWPRARRTLERTDLRRAYLLGRAAYAAGRRAGAAARATRPARTPRDPVARCTRI